MSTNHEIARLLNEAAFLLDVKGIAWKPSAYQRAAKSIEDLEIDIKKLFEEKGEKGLQGIPGVGRGIASHIKEYLVSGKVKKFEALKKNYPSTIFELANIEWLGPHKIRALYEELGINSIESLQKAAKEHKIQKVPGFSEKSEKNILYAIGLVEKRGKRKLINQADRIAKEIIEYLQKNAPIEKIEIAGSLRRRREIIGDIDLLVTSKNPMQVSTVFKNYPDSHKVVLDGEKKTTIELKDGMHLELRIFEPSEYATALIHTTGNQQHNIELRKIALKHNWKISEYGLFDRDGKKFPIQTEEDFYKKLGFSYIPPQLRENRGELEQAKKGNLPELIFAKDLKGNLHTHSNYSDGVNSLESMVIAAKEKGYEYLAMTDHSVSARIANGLDEKRFRKQWAEISKLEKKHDIRIFKGVELEILKDGSLDFADSFLKEFDIVIGSIHSFFRLPSNEMTARIIKALENPNVDIFGHPSARLIGKREPIEADFDKIFEKTALLGKIIEINGQPMRLDLNDELIIQAKKYKNKFSISSDTHFVHAYNYIEYGVDQAKRGWVTKDEVVNSLPIEKLSKFFPKLS